MTILNNNSAKLNEIVFENRNKNYGAYVIRAEYNQAIVKSLLALSALVIVLFLTVFIYTKTLDTPISQSIFVTDDLMPKELVYEVELQQPKQSIELPENKKASSDISKDVIATKIVDDPLITTNTVTTTNIVSELGKVDVSNTLNTNAIAGTSTLQTVGLDKKVEISEPVFIAEEMPEYEGGVKGLMRYIAQSITYPETAKIIGKEGTVYVSFIVNELGNVENAKVIKGIGYGCDEEVLNVVSTMPRWKKVGKNGGHPVKVRFNIPVSFKLK